MVLALLALLASSIGPARAEDLPAPTPAADLPAPVDDEDIAADDARLFTPAPPHDPIAADYGVVFFGDAGSGSRAQTAVAHRVGEFCATTRCDEVVLLGDNFYPRGVLGPNDPLWTSRFVDVYGALGLPFWPALGNHDYLGSPGAQVGWTVPAGTPSTWNMPDRYYARDVGPARIIAVDTNGLVAKQKKWLKAALAAPGSSGSQVVGSAGSEVTAVGAEPVAGAPRPPWTIVYGHHPVWSGGAHGDTRQMRSWGSLLRRADFYLCGHDHDQQVIVRPGLVEVVMGSGGAGLRATRPTTGSQLSRREFGFGYLALRGDTAEVVVVSIDGSVVARFPFTHAAIEAGAAPPR